MDVAEVTALTNNGGATMSGNYTKKEVHNSYDY